MNRTRRRINQTSVRKEIRAYILRTFLPGESEGDLRDDDLLFESGLIDSLGAMTLITHLETRFQIRITDEDLYPENFESVNRITLFVVSRLRSVQKDKANEIALN